MTGIILIVVMVFLYTMFLRVILVTIIRSRARDIVTMNSVSALENHTPWLDEWKSYDNISYDRMMWSLHKWTFKQFYGDLKEMKK